jgi:hypothetical protein
LPLRDEYYFGEIDSDNDGGVYGTLCTLACHHMHALLNSSTYPTMLVCDPISNSDTFMCELLWLEFETRFQNIIIYSNNHGGSFTHNFHTSNFIVFR